jgi:hypothetical protein|tara:strand:- start:887 stop:1108 length:222 start_codon:yes stop_codon:yes gene_type:complete
MNPDIDKIAESITKNQPAAFSVNFNHRTFEDLLPKLTPVLRGQLSLLLMGIAYLLALIRIAMIPTKKVGSDIK